MGVTLFNYLDVDLEVKVGDRVAQLIIERIMTPDVLEMNARLHLVDSVKFHRPLLRETTLFPFIQTLISYQEPQFIALLEEKENSEPAASHVLLFKPY
ncbi:hypothetical protein QYF36_005468 [Acer negundo]|nr:hypothetical protein QYF36_005468 [Acer negundo]